PGARRVHEPSIEAVESAREFPPIRMDDLDVRRAEPTGALIALAPPRLVHLDGRDVAGEHRRLAPGCRAEIERALALPRADREPDELRRRALRPDPTVVQRGLVDTRDVPGTGDLGIRRALDLSPNQPDDRGRGLVQSVPEGEGG